MAKVVYTPVVDGIVGRVNTGVYYRAKSTLFGYLRSYVRPAYTTQNANMGLRMSRISTYFFKTLTATARGDLDAYTALYKALPGWSVDLGARANSSFAVFMKLCFAITRDSEGLFDFMSATVEDWETGYPAALTIKGAVEQGFLPAVDGYEDFTKVFWA